MRKALLFAAIFGVFGTGCGGCLDDKSAPSSTNKAPTVGATARNVGNMRFAVDGGGPGLYDPAVGDR